MHYTISYENLSPLEKHAKAIRDIKDYMGEERYNHLSKLFKTDYPNITVEQFQVMVDFAGIRGYPALAWYNQIYGL